MFCDKCGTTLQEDQLFCSRCGKEVAAGVMTDITASLLRQHIRLLGIFWLALSALDGLMGVASYIVANTVFSLDSRPGRPTFLHPLLSFIGILVVIKAFAGFATGWGLIQREPWARTLAVVFAFPSLFFNVPFGTALGIYTLWVGFRPIPISSMKRKCEARAQQSEPEAYFEKIHRHALSHVEGSPRTLPIVLLVIHNFPSLDVILKTVCYYAEIRSVFSNCYRE